MPKISPNGGKSLSPYKCTHFRGVYKRFPDSPKRGRNFPQPPKGEGGRRSGLKRRRHILFRMEENKQVGVTCKKSVDVELFDGFKHCHACGEKRRVYRKQFANYIRRNQHNIS